MDKLFAVAFTPEELAIVMASIIATKSMCTEGTMKPWIYASYDTALAKCEAIRPEAMKHRKYK